MLRKLEMKKKSTFVALTLSALVGLLVLTACASTASALETKERGRGYGNVTPADEPQRTRAGASLGQNAPNQGPGGELTGVEAEGLLFMREEEKLARDVYLALYDQWQLQVFSNIADSESTHMEAVKTLIDRYELADPVEGNVAGEFANQELQALYDQLVEQGSLSLVDALQVGAAIEEIDILDLEEYLAQTDKADIQRVYDNLMRGSRNHLRAFVTNLERQGITYEPSYLSAEQLGEILSSGVEQGSGQGGQGGQGGRGGQGGQGGQTGGSNQSRPERGGGRRLQDGSEGQRGQGERRGQGDGQGECL
jgi:hypothetical protein